MDWHRGCAFVILGGCIDRGEIARMSEKSALAGRRRCVGRSKKSSPTRCAVAAESRRAADATLRLSRELLRRLCGGDDRDAFVAFHRQQIGIARHDQVGAGRDCGGDHLIVIGDQRGQVRIDLE